MHRFRRRTRRKVPHSGPILEQWGMAISVVKLLTIITLGATAVLWTYILLFPLWGVTLL